jgi:large subunit ribosomal protein L24
VFEGETVQTTLLGLAIALIVALVAALVGPYFVDWNQFRPQFEAEATRIVGAPVRVGGKLDARLLPTPSLQLHSVVVGGANDLGKVRADKLDVEFSLGSLMRGEWRATELTINGVALDLGLDRQGRIDWPASTGTFSLGSLAIDRLNVTGRIALHDAASRGTLELTDIAFSGDVRALAGSIRGDGNFTLSGTRYPFRVSSGDSTDGKGTRIHLNIDPGAKPFAADLEGVLSLQTRTPRFDGAVTLSSPANAKPAAAPPWRVVARVKADSAGAGLEQLEASYGADDRALKFVGLAEVNFGAEPSLHAVLSARQLDADKFVATDNDKNDKTAKPVRLLPSLRALVAAMPQPPIPAKVELSSEQIMLGGRPLQNITAIVHGDANAWSVDRLDFRAPGSTQVALSGANSPSTQSGDFKSALTVDSSDPDALMSWLQGRGETPLRSQKPLHLRGDVSVATDRIAIDAMKAEIDGGAVTGRIAVAKKSADGGSHFDAELKADRLDLDAATAFVRALAGPQGEWPDEAQLSLDVGHAVAAGQQLGPLLAKLGYDPKTIAVDQLKVGQPGNFTIQGNGHFDRAGSTGKLTLDSTAASLGRLTALIAPFAPSVAERLNAMGSAPGPARIKLALDLGKPDSGKSKGQTGHATAVLDLDAPQLKGNAVITAMPSAEAISSFDVDAFGHSAINIETKVSAERGRALLALLGLDRVIAPGEGPVQFEGSAEGAWRAPLRLKAKFTGKGLDAEADGTAEPWAQEAKANLNLRIRSADLAPLFDLKPSDALAQNVALSSRVSLAGKRLDFNDLDSTIAGARLRGNLALRLGDEKSIDGELGLDQVSLSPVVALAIGASGHNPDEPLGPGLLKGWHGKIAFQALRGTLPGGGEMRPVSGTVKSDGQSLTFDGIKGKIGGGDVTATIDARPGANGIALNVQVQLNGADGSALHYRGLAMPSGRASLQMTLAAQGRSTSALMGALSGSGTVTLESSAISGLDPRAFEVAINASDAGHAMNEAQLRQLVDPVLASGALLVASAQIPFTIRDGRLRVAATTLDAGGVHAIVSGGYDIPADQADIRAVVALAEEMPGSGHPEIQIFAAGTPDKLNRTVDVSALSSWLSVRAIDRETKRLDSIERGETPQALPPSVPPPALVLPSTGTPAAAAPGQPGTDVPVPGREPRRAPVRPRVSAPRLAPANPPPVVSQQVTPLPPPIEVRPVPGAGRAPPPRPRPPLVLTPPPAAAPQ